MNRAIHNLQSGERILSNGRCLGLVHEPEYGDHILILRLGNEFSDDTNVIEATLRVCVSHWPVKESNGAETTRMIPAVLASRHSVQVKVDPQTVFPRPFDGLQEIPVSKSAT